MIATVCLALLLGTTTPPPAAGEGVRWAQLREGNTREQVGALLGEPLFRNASRGHERWVYDAGADVQFENGTVKWWTAPRQAPAPAAAVASSPAVSLRQSPESRTRG